MQSFSLASTPLLHFGPEKVSLLPTVTKSFGSRVLLVTGKNSFRTSGHYTMLCEQWGANKTSLEECIIAQEPTPAMIDIAVQQYNAFDPNVVVAIGGGSVLDAGKAIAAMLLLNEPIKDYLEGVGSKNHPGTKVPFIAIPTTAGTGSEATKNAVLSETGAQGYKKSLRHNNFVPNVAIVDPLLMISCPPATTAASGMDAFTQLLESYISTNANPITDALAIEGLECVSRSLLNAFHDGANINARTDMALAAYLSGITLANAGLGLVHGFASSIGGYFDIPHGVICSSLMAAANKVTVNKLRTHKSNDEAFIKYAAIGKLFSDDENKSKEYYIDYLLSLIESWSQQMRIPGLTKCGVTPSDFKRIVSATDNKNNPVALNREDMIGVLSMAG